MALPQSRDCTRFLLHFCPEAEILAHSFATPLVYPAETKIQGKIIARHVFWRMANADTDADRALGSWPAWLDEANSEDLEESEEEEDDENDVDKDR